MSPLQRREDISLHQIGSESVLKDPEQQRVHVVNSTAAWVWERLDGSRSVDQIGTELAARYAIPVDVAHRDVSQVLESFRELGLLA